MKRCSCADGAFDVDFAGMFLNDAVGDGKAEAGAAGLAIAARSLLETEVRSLRDPKLALAFAIKSSRMNGKDAEIQEILAEAYWLNGDRAHAVEAIQKSLGLIEQTPTPTRQKLERTLRMYQGS